MKDHIVGDSGQNGSQKTGVLQKLLGAKTNTSLIGVLKSYLTAHEWKSRMEKNKKSDSPSAADVGGVFLGIILLEINQKRLRLINALIVIF